VSDPGKGRSGADGELRICFTSVMDVYIYSYLGYGLDDQGVRDSNLGGG
jgi:hypothetical protein